MRNGRYVYVNDFDTGDVHGFAVERNGALVPIPGSPFPTGVGVAGLNGMSAARRIVASVSQLEGSLSAFRVGRRGALGPGPNSPLAIGNPATDFVYNVNVDRRGRFAYAGDCGVSAQVHAVAIRRRTAELTLLPESAYDEVCGGVALIRRKRLAVAIEDEDEAQVFKRSRDGSLEPMTAPQDVAGGDSHAISRKGRLLVVSDDESDTVTSYAVDRKTGALIQVDQQSIAGARDVNQTLLIRR